MKGIIYTTNVYGCYRNITKNNNNKEFEEHGDYDKEVSDGISEAQPYGAAASVVCNISLGQLSSSLSSSSLLNVHNVFLL